ncbi:hypothetical protein PV327_000713 [Microctonus hyperodae]|uniref:Amino acid transporter transmembrane domain-containing protein n=1 Tax=Microctonus hyperodae TaxID=165561 RepID=A0AA39L283_MICHY|nr:hypothetical protein PV327_000713 [Microctonus hyperodae]
MSLISDADELLDNNIEVTLESRDIRSRSAPEGSMSIIGTIFLIVNATLGAGLLNFPLAFDKSGGIASAMIIQLVLLIFITAALVTLANCSDITKTTSMQETVAELCGPKTLFLCGICITIYSFGCCLTLIIIIGDQFERVLATYYGMDYCHHWFLSRTFITSITCTVFILPLSFFKRLDALSYASSIGCTTIIYVVWLIIYESVSATDYPKPTQSWPNNISQALEIVPIICFAYQSHMTAIPTYACMKNRNVYSFTWTFGIGHVPSDILQGYTDKSVTLAIAIIAVAVKNFTTYPIILFCGRNSLLDLINPNFNHNLTVRITVTFLWFISTLIISIILPDISPVINFLGTLSAAFIFLFPGVCLLQSTLIKDPSLYLNKNRFFIIAAIIMTAIGAFVTGFVFVQTFDGFYKESSAKRTLISELWHELGTSLCT